MVRRLQNSWFFDDYYSRRAINEHADELETVEGNVDKLQLLVKRQAEELLMLRAYVIGIANVLREKAAFDDAELDAAVSEVWAALTAPPPPPDPSINLPKPAVRDERPITCAKCGKSVPAYRTIITAQGEICDSCSDG